MTLDDIDMRILGCLQQNARCTNVDIARCVDMAPSAVLERIRKLERNGVIRGYQVDVDPEALGLALLAFLFVRAAGGPADSGTAEKIALIPEVLEVHHIAGEDCFLVKVRCGSPRDLRRILTDELGRIGTVLSTRSTIVLDSVKESSRLPLPEPDEGRSCTPEAAP